MGFMCACAPSMRAFFKIHLRGPLSKLRCSMSDAWSSWTWTRVSQRPRADSDVELVIQTVGCPYEQVRDDSTSMRWTDKVGTTVTEDRISVRTSESGDSPTTGVKMPRRPPRPYSQQLPSAYKTHHYGNTNRTQNSAQWEFSRQHYY